MNHINTSRKASVSRAMRRLAVLALVVPLTVGGLSPAAAAVPATPVVVASQVSVAAPASLRIAAAPTRKHATAVLPFGAGSRVTTHSTKKRTHAVNLPTSAQRAVLQKKVGKKWKNAVTMKLMKWGSSKRATFAVTPPKPGKTDTYRIHVYKTKTHRAYVSKSQQLHLPMQSSQLHSWPTHTRIIASNHQAKVDGFLAGGRRTVQLQRQYKGKWQKVATKKSNSRGSYSFMTPKSQATTKYKYRVHAPQSGVFKKGTTKAFTLQHENPRHYKGYRKTIYNHVKKRCPNILIRTAKPNKKWDGLAHMGQNKITVVTGRSGKRLKHISLHECAHMLQDKAYKGNYNQLKNRMNKIYKTKGTRGLENNADCIARKIGSPGPYSYNSNCKGARGTAATKIIQGKRP